MENISVLVNLEKKYGKYKVKEKLIWYRFNEWIFLKCVWNLFYWMFNKYIVEVEKVNILLNKKVGIL